MLTKEEIIKKIEENKNEIRKFGVKSLALFGSYAYEDNNKNSDIDLLVEFKKGRGLFDDYFKLMHFLEDLFEKDIDLVKQNLIKESIRSSIMEGRRVEAKI